MLNFDGYYLGTPLKVNERNIKNNDWFLCHAYMFSKNGTYRRSSKFFKTPEEISFDKTDFEKPDSDFRINNDKLLMTFFANKKFENIVEYRIISKELLRSVDNKELSFRKWN